MAVHGLVDKLTTLFHTCSVPLPLLRTTSGVPRVLWLRNSCKEPSPWPLNSSLPLSIWSPLAIEGLQPSVKPLHQVMVLSAVPPGRSMEVTAPTTLSVLNGSDTRLPCTFNSCYTVNHKQFSLNWTYQECSNCSEEMVSRGGGGGGGKEARAPKREAHHSHP